MHPAHSWFQRANELGANIDLPHANGVRPEHMTIGQGLLELGIILTKPLAEVFLPIAPAAHPHKIVR